MTARWLEQEMTKREGRKKKREKKKIGICNRPETYHLIVMEQVHNIRTLVG